MTRNDTPDIMPDPTAVMLVLLIVGAMCLAAFVMGYAVGEYAVDLLL